MTVRRVPGTDRLAVHCDAPDCRATVADAVTYRGAVQWAGRTGWAVTVTVADPRIVDLCPRCALVVAR